MKRKSKTHDMTSGNILLQLVVFSLPLLVGNVFQMLYNTVDTYVVGNYVGKQALAAVGSTFMMVNIVVFFFNGLSIGAGVIISQRFGAGDEKRLHDAIETTIAMTLGLCVFFTALSVPMVRPMLRFMATPADVTPEATTYLRIYMAGISGVMIYNMGSGILRAVGDTTRPLYFLIITSVLNVILDLFFVLVLHLGVAGVALATVLSQFVSALLVLVILTKTNEIYKLSWQNLHLDRELLRQILLVGLPTAIQSMFTCFSNTFVQSHINVFGSSVVAGWSCYNKLEQFTMLPIDSMSKAAPTFVGQNIGAGNERRANRGTATAIIFGLCITLVFSVCLIIFSEPATAIFSKDKEVISFGVLFVRTNMVFIFTNCVNHVLAGALRGRGDSKGPMIIMLCTFVGIRQLYLFLVTHFVANTPISVALSYPVGWISCCICEVCYYFFSLRRRNHPRKLENGDTHSG